MECLCTNREWPHSEKLSPHMYLLYNFGPHKACYPPQTERLQDKREESSAGPTTLAVFDGLPCRGRTDANSFNSLQILPLAGGKPLAGGSTRLCNRTALTCCQLVSVKRVCRKSRRESGERPDLSEVSSTDKETRE